MDAALLLRILEATYRPLVEAHGGELHVASDPDHALEILAAAAPRGWRAVLAWAGDTAPDPDSAPGIVDLDLASTVQAARGLPAARGASAIHPRRGGPEALPALAAWLDARLRGFRPPGDTDSRTDIDWRRGLRHVSSAWLELDGLPTRQITTTHRITIALAAEVVVRAAGWPAA